MCFKRIRQAEMIENDEGLSRHSQKQGTARAAEAPKQRIAGLQEMCIRDSIYTGKPLFEKVIINNC